MITLDRVESLLPNPPDGYEYQVEQMSPLVIRVWLVHPPYNYTTDIIRTVYCFIKSGKVYPPKNYKTARPKSVCDVLDLFKQPSYTTIIPKVTSLIHLF